jgi:predicted phosphodiesterase
MVKRLRLFLFIIAVSFITACNVDMAGSITSTDLDERLKEKDNLKFLQENGWTELSLDSEYSFIVVSDIHIEDGNAYGFERLKDVIDADEKIQFVVVCGDVTQYGSAGDIGKFIEIILSFGVPCYTVIGNHDIYFGNWSVWKEKIGSTRYRVNDTTGVATIFVLDTANAFYGRNQLDWLEGELKNARGRVFVFTHSNLFFNYPLDIPQTTDIRERARVVSILRNKCDSMFMGHTHRRNITETGNVHYITIEDFLSARAYCLVTVTSSGVTRQFKNL